MFCTTKSLLTQEPRKCVTVEELWVSLLFKTKHCCILDGVWKWGVGSWGSQTVWWRSKHSFLHLLFHFSAACLKTSCFTHLAVGGWAKLPLQFTDVALIRWACSTFAPSWFGRGTGSHTGTGQNIWNTFGFLPDLSCSSSLAWGLCHSCLPPDLGL